MDVSSDDDDNRLLTRIRTKDKTLKTPAKVTPNNVVDESSDDDEAMLQRHDKRAGLKAPANRQPRPSLGALPAAKALAKTQDTEARQSFRGRLTFNPMRVSAAQPTKPESDSEEEQWQRIKAATLKPATAATRKLSAVTPPRAALPAPAQDRRLSLSKGASSSAPGKPANVHETDSDEEHWQRVKKMVKERPKELPARAGLAPPSGRLSIRASPGALPSNVTSRPGTVAAVTRGWGVSGQRKSGGKVEDASDSDEEQWQRVKAQVSAARAAPQPGPLPRESRSSIRTGQARVTQDMLPGRQRRSASMHLSPTTQSALLAGAARRASVPSSSPSIDAATPFQVESSALSSFVGGGMSYRLTTGEHAQPPMHPPLYQPAAMRVTGSLPDDRVPVTGEDFFLPEIARRSSRTLPTFEEPTQPVGTATYAVPSIALGPTQQPQHQDGVYEAPASHKHSLLAHHMQETLVREQLHGETMAQQSMPAYSAQLPAARRDSLAAAQVQQYVTKIGQVQADRRESVAAPRLHQSCVGNERMHEEMQTLHALGPQVRPNIDVDERMNEDVYAVPQTQLEHQLQVQTSRRQSVTAAQVQQSLGNFAQAQAGSRGSFAAPQLQQSFPTSQHLQEEVAAPQAQPQPRQSRLSRDAQPQGELLQTRAASLPPLAARVSHAAVRRASAPINALPNIPEEPPAALGPSPAGTLFSKRRSSAGASLSRSSSGTAIQLQPNTPQQQREHSRRSSLAPVAPDASKQPSQRFDGVAPRQPDTFDPTALPAAYGVAVVDHKSDMQQEDAAAEHRSSGRQGFPHPQIARPASSPPDAHLHLQPVPQPEHLGRAAGTKRVGSRGSLSRTGNSFSFPGGSTGAEQQQYDLVQLPSELSQDAPNSTLHAPAPRRAATIGEGHESPGWVATLRSEPTLSPAAYTEVLQEGSVLHAQPAIQDAPPRDQRAERLASQPGRRASDISTDGASSEFAHAQIEADVHHVPQSALRVPDGVQRLPAQEGGGGLVPDNRPFEHEQDQQQDHPEGRVHSNMAWSPRLRDSSAADSEDLSSVRATGSPAWSSVRVGSMTARQTGKPATWRGGSAPPGVPPRSPPDDTVPRWGLPEGHEEWGEQGAPPPAAFTVYDNQVAASAHAADQLLHSAAAQQAAQAEHHGQALGATAVDRESLETVIMQAVQASMSSALTTLSTDVQQLNVKCGEWWQRSEDMCAHLHQEIGQLRRGTADDISAISARLALIEAHKSEASIQPEPREAVPPAARAASDWDQTFAVDIIERLDSLEARVACQLDQLTSAHHKRITDIKGNLHASVAEAAAAAQSRPGSPTQGPKETPAAELLPPLPRLAPPMVEIGSGEARDSNDAASKKEHPQEAQPTATQGHGYAGYKEMARKLEKLEASHKLLAAADRCKGELAVTDAVAAAALDKRLCAMEERLHSTHAQAAEAGSAAHGAQQRIAAAEWRIEKVATACAATVKALTTRQERLGNSLSLVKGTASLADAKCAALGAEIAKLYRDSGLKRSASPCEKEMHRIPRPPALVDGGQHACMY